MKSLKSLPVLHANALALSALMVLAVAPTAQADVAYTANEGTETVSVIDTASGRIVTTIGLGSGPAIPGTPQPNGPFNGEKQHHGAFYNGQVDPHGLWLTPDGKTLLVSNRISGTVVAIDTATNKVLAHTPTGREVHLTTVRPGGKEAWAALRGESYIDILEIDPRKLRDKSIRPTARMPSIGAIDTVMGPSMVSFTSDGKTAFVVAGKQARLDKIDADRREIVASQNMPARFSPFGLVTPDDKEIYIVHKGAGKLSVVRTDDLSFLVNGFSIGARANHVWFSGNLTYISIGGPKPSASNPDPEGKVVIVDRGTRKVVRELTGPAFTGDPHAVWADNNGRLFLGHERGSRVTIIALNDLNNPDDDTVTGTVTGSVQDLAYLRKPVDLVIRR